MRSEDQWSQTNWSPADESGVRAARGLYNGTAHSLCLGVQYSRFRALTKPDPLPMPSFLNPFVRLTRLFLNPFVS